MQPIVAYARAALEQLDGRCRAAVRATPAEALNWRPGDETTNSPAMIVRHIASGQRLLLHLALGNALPQALDMRARGLHNDPATHDELLELLDRAAARREGLLARLDALDLGETVPSPRGAPHARFGYIALSVAEAAEHIGHLELTRQLWARHDGGRRG